MNVGKENRFDPTIYNNSLFVVAPSSVYIRIYIVQISGAKVSVARQLGRVGITTWESCHA